MTSISPQLASPPTPLQGGEGSNMQCYYNVNDKIMLCRSKTFYSPLPLGEGLGVRPVVGWLWFGKGRLWFYFLGSHSAGFSRHSFNSTTSSLAMYPVSTAFCTTCS